MLRQHGRKSNGIRGEMRLMAIVVHIHQIFIHLLQSWFPNDTILISVRGSNGSRRAKAGCNWVEVLVHLHDFNFVLLQYYIIII